jgi:hypothetical protein
MSSHELADFEAFDNKLILDQLTDQERARSSVYLDQNLHPPGQTLIGGRKVQPDHTHVIAFVDQRPGANWMHPCRYLLIDPATRQVTSIDSDRPPMFGILPATWREVWRSPGIANWQMLPMSHPAPQATPNEKKEKP